MLSRWTRMCVLSAGLFILGALAVTPVLGQTPDHLQQVEQRLAQKRAAAEAHRRQMEAIKDPERLSVEMRKHFQMTEEILALMLERRQLTQAHGSQATPPAAGQPAPSQPGMTGPGGMPSGGMEREKGGMQGGAMPGPGMQGGGMMEHGMRGGMQGGMQQEKGGMQGGGPTPPPAGTTPAPAMSDMQQMMQRIAEHSAYMETLKDRNVLAQEMLRHQKMLDQMLQLMQQ